MSDVDVATLATAREWGCANDLSGMSFCLTGPMSLTRANMEAVIVALGGEAHSAIKKSTTYLVIPDSDDFRKGSKYRAAMQQNVEIITEEDLGRMIMPTLDQLV